VAQKGFSMMYLLHAIALAAWMFGWIIIVGWHGPLDARLSLGGLYLLIGTVAATGSALLWRSRDE
jgi:hypothetical protein